MPRILWHTSPGLDVGRITWIYTPDVNTSTVYCYATFTAKAGTHPRPHTAHAHLTHTPALPPRSAGGRCLLPLLHLAATPAPTPTLPITRRLPTAPLLTTCRTFCYVTTTRLQPGQPGPSLPPPDYLTKACRYLPLTTLPARRLLRVVLPMGDNSPVEQCMCVAGASAQVT